MIYNHSAAAPNVASVSSKEGVVQLILQIILSDPEIVRLLKIPDNWSAKDIASFSTEKMSINVLSDDIEVIDDDIEIIGGIKRRGDSPQPPAAPRPRLDDEEKECISGRVHPAFKTKKCTEDALHAYEIEDGEAGWCVNGNCYSKQTLDKHLSRPLMRLKDPFTQVEWEDSIQPFLNEYYNGEFPPLQHADDDFRAVNADQMAAMDAILAQIAQLSRLDNIDRILADVDAEMAQIESTIVPIPAWALQQQNSGLATRIRQRLSQLTTLVLNRVANVSIPRDRMQRMMRLGMHYIRRYARALGITRMVTLINDALQEPQ